MPSPLITLTTDFGEGSPYVAQLKAAALKINPEVRLLDITHSIAPQDVQQGALILADVTRHFPPGTIHVCVVDPGVGTERQIVYAELGEQRFVAPDNGLLSLVAEDGRLGELRSIQAGSLAQRQVSVTFHGRDIMVPAAAHLSLGVTPDQLGPPVDKLTTLAWPEVECQAETLMGAVLWVDSFGNLITNITRDMLPAGLPTAAFHAQCGGHDKLPLVLTYGQVQPGTLVALFGSSDRLEIAETNGNAAARLAGGVGSRVRLSWSYDIV